MSEKRVNSWAFCQADAHPTKKRAEDTAHTAVHCLAVANQSSWEDAYEALLQEAHSLCMIPNDPQVVKSLLRSQGFVLQPGVSGRVTIEDLCRRMNEICHDGQIALAMLTQNGTRTLVPIVPETHTKFTQGRSTLTRYQCLTPRYPTIGIQEVWVRWADGQDHSPIPRRKGRGMGVKGRKIPDDHETFHFLRENPLRFTGDCAVRAMATTCGITWHEALDLMARHNQNLCTTINSDSAIHEALVKEGFVPHKPLRREGVLLTGSEFCQVAADNFKSNEHIYAFCGRNHVVAVMPFRNEDGSRSYKICDIFDSTGRKISQFYVKDFTPRKVRAPKPQKITGELAVNQKLLHPVFGEGFIREIPDPRWIRVEFSTGEKPLESRWVRENCCLRAG